MQPIHFLRYYWLVCQRAKTIVFWILGGWRFFLPLAILGTGFLLHWFAIVKFDQFDNLLGSLLGEVIINLIYGILATGLFVLGLWVLCIPIASFRLWQDQKSVIASLAPKESNLTDIFDKFVIECLHVESEADANSLHGKIAAYSDIPSYRYKIREVLKMFKMLRKASFYKKDNYRKSLEKTRQRIAAALHDLAESFR